MSSSGGASLWRPWWSWGAKNITLGPTSSPAVFLSCLSPRGTWGPGCGSHFLPEAPSLTRSHSSLEDSWGPPSQSLSGLGYRCMAARGGAPETGLPRAVGSSSPALHPPHRLSRPLILK